MTGVIGLEWQYDFFGLYFGPGVPLTYRIGLSSTEPDVEGNNITNPGGNYEGVLVSGTDFTVYHTGSEVYVANNNFIDFIQSGPTVPWGTIPYWTFELQGKGTWDFFAAGVITDRDSGLPSPVTIGTEDYFTFDPNKFIIRFKDPGGGA